MAIAKMTPETAPRDAATLMEKGKFQRRELAKDLGIIAPVATPEHEPTLLAWGKLTDDEGVAQLLEALKAFDKQGGGGKTSEAANAVPPTGALKRTPRNTEAAPAAPAAATSAVGDGGAILEALAKNQKTLEALQKSEALLHEKIEALSVNVGVVMALSIMIAEASVGDRASVFAAAIEEAKGFLDAVGKANKKK